MARNYAALPHDYLEEMEALSSAEFGRLCRALLKYSATGEEEPLQGSERLLLKRVILQERRFQKSYEEQIQAKRTAGKKGAEKRWGSLAEDSGPAADHGKHGKTETQTNTNTNTETETKRKTDPLPCQDGEGEPLFAAFGPQLQEAVSQWLRYKQERREGYPPTGRRALLGEIQSHAAQYGEAAVAQLIHSCMAAGWRGIIFDRLEKGQKTGTEGRLRFLEAAAELELEQEAEA